MDETVAGSKSINREELDGHFGFCLRYLIYQLSPQEIRVEDLPNLIQYVDQSFNQLICRSLSH